MNVQNRILSVLLVLILLMLTACDPASTEIAESTTECSVQLTLNGALTCTYPAYGTDGWSSFTAHPVIQIEKSTSAVVQSCSFLFFYLVSVSLQRKTRIPPSVTFGTVSSLPFTKTSRSPSIA